MLEGTEGLRDEHAFLVDATLSSPWKHVVAAAAARHCRLWLHGARLGKARARTGKLHGHSCSASRAVSGALGLGNNPYRIDRWLRSDRGCSRSCRQLADDRCLGGGDLHGASSQRFLFDQTVSMRRVRILDSRATRPIFYTLLASSRWCSGGGPAWHRSMAC